jgi:hypothetical protein
MAKPVYSTGDVPTATDFNEWLVNVRWARKSANLDRSSTTTFTDDPDLTLTVLANAVYEVRSSLLIHSSSQVAGDFKFKFTGPAGAVLLSTVTGYDVAATTNNNVVTTGMTLNTSASLGIVSLVEPWNPVQIDGCAGHLRHRRVLHPAMGAERVVGHGDAAAGAVVPDAQPGRVGGAPPGVATSRGRLRSGRPAARIRPEKWRSQRGHRPRTG